MRKHPKGYTTAKLMLFWSDMAALRSPFARLAYRLLVGRAQQRPEDHVRSDIPRKDRELVANILRTGERGEMQMGYARCRLCGRRLGNRDMVGFGFVWPELAEHYILDHGVWTPECYELLDAQIRARSAEIANAYAKRGQ